MILASFSLRQNIKHYSNCWKKKKKVHIANMKLTILIVRFLEELNGMVATLEACVI